MNIISKLAGKFQITKFDRHGITKIYPWSNNLVLDSGLNQIGIGNFLTHCYVGSGNSEPIPTQSALDSQVGSTTTILSQSTSASPVAPYYGYMLIQFRFSIGTVTGNLSEVGVGWADALFSRALILDEYNEPVTITVLSTEGLVVTYMLRNYVPEIDNTFITTIADISRTCVVRTANATLGSVSVGWGITGTKVGLPATNSIIAYDGNLSAVTQVPSGTAANSTNGTTNAYSNNSYEIGLIGQWNQATANYVGGIKSFFLPSSGMGAFQISVDPAIMKTNDRILTMSFKVQWGR